MSEGRKDSQIPGIERWQHHQYGSPRKRGSQQDWGRVWLTASATEVTEGAESGDWPDPTDLLKIFLAPRRDWMRMGQEDEERDQLKG